MKTWSLAEQGLFDVICDSTKALMRLEWIENKEREKIIKILQDGINKMSKKSIEKIKTKEEARQIAIDWQTWQSKMSMAYGEVSQWQAYFEGIAKKFNLTKEFKENGII